MALSLAAGNFQAKIAGIFYIKIRENYEALDTESFCDSVLPGMGSFSNPMMH